MRKPQGYAIAVDPSGKTSLECDTITCNHCNTVVLVRPKEDINSLGGFCRLCMKNICSSCVSKNCSPFEKKLLEMEARDRLLRSVGV